MQQRYAQGRTQGGEGPPWDLKNTIFSGFLPLNYVICIFQVCFLSFLLCGRTEEACSMVNSLRKVDFSHPTGQYTCKKIAAPPPLRKSWVRPWVRHWALPAKVHSCSAPLSRSVLCERKTGGLLRGPIPLSPAAASHMAELVWPVTARESMSQCACLQPGQKISVWLPSDLCVQTVIHSCVRYVSRGGCHGKMTTKSCREICGDVHFVGVSLQCIELETHN